ncbi:MAG: Soluble lytic murein transglycosylase precursor [Pelotomaculum sp. PtaB.Bin104]|nr:MAG: Soluble lytic murein transglycosylase precursor [Pelotomaculum sp. PtaB.Bin104]
MTAYRRRLNKGKLKNRLILLLLLLLIIFNFDHIARIFNLHLVSGRLPDEGIKKIARIFYPFPHKEIIEHYAGTYGVDPYLVVAMMKAESNFNQRAISESGALGLMQIMPETGQWAAKQNGGPPFSPEQLFEVDTNIKLGTWYIADLGKEFHGDAVLILAAYNGGRGNVREWLANGTLSTWRDIKAIPFPETRHYVEKVLNNYDIYTKLYSE